MSPRGTRAMRTSRARRAAVLAKRLRAQHGLTVDLTVPCFELEQPELYDGPPWDELVARLAQYEIVVWRGILLTLKRLTGTQDGNPGFGPRR